MLEEGINPIGIAGAILGGILSLVVMSKVEVGLIFKLGAFIGTAAVCYFMVNKIFSQ